MLDLARQVAAVLARRKSAVMVTVVNARGDGGGATPGAKLLFAADARTHGTLGSEALDQVARDRAAHAIDEREPRLAQYLPDGTPAPRRSRTYVQLLYEPLLPPDRLLVIGAGHIAVPMHEIGKILGFEVIVVDDRADFATKERFPSADEVLCIPFGTVPAQITIDRATYLVLVTRAHEHDEEVLRQVADSRGAVYWHDWEQAAGDHRLSAAPGGRGNARAIAPHLRAGRPRNQRADAAGDCRCRHGGDSKCEAAWRG